MGNTMQVLGFKNHFMMFLKLLSWQNSPQHWPMETPDMFLGFKNHYMIFWSCCHDKIFATSGLRMKKIPSTTTIVISSINRGELFVNGNTVQVLGFKNHHMIFLKLLLHWKTVCNMEGCAWRKIPSTTTLVMSSINNGELCCELKHHAGSRV